MKNKLTLAFVLFASALSLAATFPAATIVATGKIKNQGQIIQPLAIYTPQVDGQYRLSLYATLTQVDPLSNSYWNVSASWTDDAGPEGTGPFLVGHTQFLTQFFFQGKNGFGAPVVTFESKGGSPINIAVTQTGPQDSSEYSLYYVLEVEQ
jgi:hypothetical protein